MTALHAILAGILALPNGAPIKHLRARPTSYLEVVSRETEDAARMAGVSLSLYAALVVLESHYDDAAVSFNGTSLGVAQINVRSKHYRRWQSCCRAVPGSCRFCALSSGAYALREALDACQHNKASAVRFYRAGTCSGVRPMDRDVVRLAHKIAWRLRAAREAT